MAAIVHPFGEASDTALTGLESGDEEGKHNTIFSDPSFKDKLLASTLPLQPSFPAVEEAYPPPQGILDLPNEILLIIFSFLPTPALYTTSQVSRRLHYLALPLYLAENGVSPFTGDLVLYDDRSRDVLCAVEAALFRPALKSVWCTLNLLRYPEVVCREVGGLVRLLGKLDFLEEAHFDFLHYRDSTCPPAELEVGKDVVGCAPGAGRVDQLTEDMAKDVLSVLDAAVASGCTTLTVCHAGRLVLRHDEVRLVMERHFNTLKSLQNVSYSVFQRAAELVPNAITGHFLWIQKMDPQMADIPPVAIRTFNLHSSMLLHPLMCYWIICTLDNSNLESLSLNQLIDVAPNIWSIILPRLYLPNLSKLSVDLCVFYPTDFYRFIRRHPGITDLRIGRNVFSAPSVSRLYLPQNILPHLIHLSATPEYLAHLLSRAGSFPALSSISLVSRVKHREYFNFTMVNELLQPISARLAGMKKISLLLSLDSTTSEWMFLDSLPDLRDDAALLFVTHIELQIRTYRLPVGVRRALSKWLGLFPSLRHISLVTLSKTGPVELVDRPLFVEEIARYCPALESIGMNGEIHDISR